MLSSTRVIIIWLQFCLSDLAHVDDAFVFIAVVVSREATTHSIFCYLCYICGGVFASTDLIFLTLDSLTMDNLKMYLNKGMTWILLNRWVKWVVESTLFFNTIFIIQIRSGYYNCLLMLVCIILIVLCISYKRCWIKNWLLQNLQKYFWYALKYSYLTLAFTIGKGT